MKHCLCATFFSSLLGLACVTSAASYMTSEANLHPTQEQHQATATPVQADVVQTDLNESYGRLPLSFEINKGQSDPEVSFLARGAGYGLFLTPTETVLALRAGNAPSSVVRMQLLGAQPRSDLIGLDPLPGRSHYLTGPDPLLWQRNIIHYAKVKDAKVYPGIDLIYYGNQRQLEYDFIVAPGADPRAIRLAFQGIDQASLDAKGQLILTLPGGTLIHRAPVIYQDIAGERRPVEGRYTLNARREIGFAVASYDTRHPLVIDPILSYSTYLGGSSVDYGYGIALDGARNAYITGQTLSATFPTTASAFDRVCGASGSVCGGGEDADAFVSKLNATGNALVYSTFLGGSGLDTGSAIAVDSSGSAYVAGTTVSDNFPTTVGAFDRTCGPTVADDCGFGFFPDVFIAKLSPNGSTLSYSTYLGGGDFDGDSGLAIAVNTIGEVFVTGNTNSSNFPVQNPFRATKSGAEDVFVTKLVPAGNALVYSTYLGGSDADIGSGIALDSSGNAYITGATASANFPTTAGVFDRTINGLTDTFVTRLNAAGNTLGYSTFLGGAEIDFGRAIALDGTGNAYVTGDTASTNFPTTLGSFQPLSLAPNDAFVTKLSGTGNLVYSTYLAGSNDESATAIAVDSTGSAYVTGFTTSTNFPLASPHQVTLGGGRDGFVTKLSPAGNSLSYSTYLGGNGDDFGRDIAIDSANNAYITGETLSTNFSTTAGSLDISCGTAANCNGGSTDVFITKINSPPAAGTVQFGAATYSIDENGGSVTISVTRSGGSVGVIGVNYATSNGTAVAGSDYTARSGTLSFASGDNAAKTFTIPILNNAVFEPNETVNLALSNPTGGAVLAAPSNAVLTIVNDDPGTAGTLQFSAANYSMSEQDGGGTATITVTRANGSTGAVAVNYATSDGTANAGSDYTATSGTINFPAGNSAPKTFTIPIINDGDIEPTQTINLTLSNPTPNGVAILGAQRTAQLTITDIDTNLQFSAANYSVNENAGTATITVTRTGRNFAVGVSYATSNGSATAGSDYTARSGTLSFPFNVFSQTFTVPIIDNTTGEPTESLNLTLSNPTGSAVVIGSPSPATLTIVDNDTAGSPGTLQFSAPNYTSVSESGTATITVTRSGGSAGAVSVSYGTSNGTALAGADYTTSSGTLSFAAGDIANKTFTVPILADSTDEPNETVNLTLSSPTGGATLGSPNPATLTITDDDAVPPGTLQFSAASYSGNETGGTATITVTRSGGSGGAVAVSYGTANGSATAGADYTAASGTLSFADGDSTSKTFTVPITDDALAEDDETVNLTLTNPTGGATLGTPGAAVLTIVSDDAAGPPGTLQFLAANFAVSESQPGSFATITVTRTGGSGGAVSISYATSDGTAQVGSDYAATSGTLTFANGDTANKTFTVPFTDDSAVEGNETLNLALSNPTGGATLGVGSTAVLTIFNDDESLQFSTAGYSVNESAGTATITVTRNGGSTGTVGVSYATSNGSATTPSDYTAASGTLSFGVGITTQSFTVPIIDNTTVEPSETINLTLSSPTGFAVRLGSPNPATLTIVDNDAAPAGTLQFSAASYSVNENAGSATITVIRTGNINNLSIVNYTTGDGSALAGSDYTAASGSLSFDASDASSRTFVIPILNNDGTAEADETVNLTLSGASGANLGSPSAAVLTIVND